MQVTAFTTNSNKGQAAAFESALQMEFPSLQSTIVVLPLADGWVQPAHDGISLVLFGDESHDQPLCAEFEKAVRGELVIPISVVAERNIPPKPLEHLKARHWPEDRESLFRSIAAHAGLNLRTEQRKVFISFRTEDGKGAAETLYQHLSNRGFHPWLDEEELEPGDNVAEKIAENLKEAGAVLLLDTPKAPQSKWVQTEVNLAIGSLVPILPIVFDHKATPICRFRALQGLHRSVPLTILPEEKVELDEASCDLIIEKLEEYLLAVFRRRVVQARRLARVFEDNNWTFEELPDRKHLYRSKRSKIMGIPASQLLSYCSFEDRIFSPSVLRFIREISDLASQGSSGQPMNFLRNLYFYPGEIEYRENLEYLYENEVPAAKDMNVVFFNYHQALFEIDNLTRGVTFLESN